MMSACHAGYVLPGFVNALAESGSIGADALRSLLRRVAVADCESTLDLSDRKIAEDPVLRTAANFISRGLPTIPSLACERIFADAFHHSTVEEDDRGRFLSRVIISDPAFPLLLSRSLYAIAAETDEHLLMRLGKSKAAPLLKIIVPLFRELFGAASLALIESDEKHGYLQLPFPYPIAGVRGVRAHGVAQDGGSERSGLLPDGWYTLVLVPGGTKQLQADAAALKKMIAHEFPSEGIAIDAAALMSVPLAKQAIQLMLSPFAVARVQRTLLQILLAGGLDLAAAAWTFTVVERDIPGAALGISEFQRLLKTFFLLEGKGRTVPEIKVVVAPGNGFADSPLHAQGGIRLLRAGEAFPAADLHIDISVLHRTGAVLPDVPSEARNRIVLRTARSVTEPRRFYLAETQPWKALTAKGTDGFDPEVRGAVQTLLANIFRIGRPTEQQLQLIDQVLQNGSFLAALPPMAGKSLVYQFAALLQPALSFVVVPTASLAEDQGDQLRDIFVDCFECQHEAMGMELRGQARERFRDRQALLLLATSEVFRNEEIDDVLASLRREKAYFSQCVIDEAHGSSEWSHDVRPAMQLAAAFAVERLDAGKKKNIAIRLLTGSVSRDVIADLRMQLTVLGRPWALDDRQCVVSSSLIQPQQQFQLLSAPAQATDTFSILSARQDNAAHSLLSQQKTFSSLHEQAGPALRVPGWHADAPLPTVLFCPFSSGTLGVSNRYAAGASEAALDEVLSIPQHAVGIFIGKDDGRSRVGRHCLIDAIESRAQFRRGALNLLITTRAYGIGMQKPDIRCTLHLMPPPGVERLVQECGRGGHDGRLSLHTVLYGVGATSGESQDLKVGISMITAGSSDAAREKQLIHDLMREISYPEDSNTGRVANMIRDEFGVDVRISYWQRGLEERMYVQHGGNTFGHIDLVTQDIVLDPKYPESELAKEILDFAFATSLEAAGSGPSLSSWVAATFPADIDDGIARQMQDFDPGASFTLRIGYENDREPLLNQIHQLLWRQAEIEIQRKILSEVQGLNWTEFREQLLHRIGQPELFAALDPEIEARLVQLYNKIRTRSDTERIIFRLATLGAVQDYKSHPASRRFSIRINVRADHEIRSALEAYLGLFLTERQVERTLSSLHTYPGDSLLEQCLHFLVDFSYQHCYQRQIEGARAMETLCRAALKEKEDAGNFRNNIETALLAKYALPWRLPATVVRTTDRIAILSEYMKLVEEDKSASVRENAFHLQDSCARLAQNFPDEPLLPLLRAFAELINARGAASIKTAQGEFAAAFGLCASASGLEGERYLAIVADFEGHLRRYFDDQAVALLLSLLHDEVKRVKARPLPAAVSLETMEARQQATARKAAEQRAAEQRAAEQRAAEQRAAEQRAAEQRAAEQRAAEQRAAEQRAAEQRAAEQRAAEQRAAEQKAAETQAEEGKIDGSEAGRRRTSGRDADDLKESSKPVENSNGGVLDDLDLMLAELEGMLRTEDDRPGQNAQGPGAAAGARAKQSDSSPAKSAHTADAEAPEQSKAKPPIPATTRPPAKAPSPPRPKAPDPVDPELLQHMKWLQTFNNSFLKHYES
ncbi:MAG: DEAD/DEAH box helicase [Bacteroidetes bacterium]|nr:DEAD/DEAH box helicase [Bacteroidota bacterium]